MTETWFRNPHNFIRELAETRARLIAWDRGMLAKRRIDPYKHADLYFGKEMIDDWRVLLIGTQGSAELRKGYGITNPYAVYPTWESTEGLSLLEEMIANPIGDDADACNDPDIEIDERPVANQEHRVIVTDLPNVATGPGRALARKLKELQEDYPECIIHIHGLYSWRVSFGMGFGAADIDPRANASKGRVTLPTGKDMIAERTIGCPQWVEMLGMRVVDLKDPRNRCIYNIKSAVWAGENFTQNTQFKSRGDGAVDPDAKVHVPTLAKKHLSKPLTAKVGDKQVCDTCSLQTSCKFYRSGAVCSVPGTNNSELAGYFKTRDAETIVDGLGTLLAIQTRRMEKGMREEEEYGELDPEVTKIVNQIFGNAKALAQLLDPNLRGGARIQINNNGGPSVANATPNQVMAGILAMFEQRGISRSEVTPEMIAGVFADMGKSKSSLQPAVAAELIEARVISNEG